MASFSAVNTTTLDVPSTTDRVTDVQTPTTPRPHFAQPTAKDKDSEANPTTPTRHDFAGVPGQRALPDQPLTPNRYSEDAASVSGSIKRSSSHRSAGSPKDVEMGEADDDEHDSDNDSVNSDSRPSKKKKGQRFFCTEFPPCQLSFTRSEHLARHIRKHTGERPFQCHCSRRFSRLDNLRQHAQTVHVNEDIPGDSLAATSTRFQRQIRTDRVRPPNGRARANTLGSSGTHSRGHSRNLSTSSIGSTTSSIASPEDVRRRPQPLAMANDPSARARLSLNTFDSGNNPSAPQYAYYNQSPSGYSTPTSTTFSAGPGSPRSAFPSPSSTISRSSYYNGPRQGHSRRLSVPSGANPFNPAATSYPPPFLSPLASGTSSTFSQSGTGFGSPTSSVYSHSRRDSESELEFRRRTWHPSTYSSYSQRPATSGLTYHQTVDDQRPSTSNQPAASQMTRLPGIESFDHAPPPSARPQLGEPMSDIRPTSSAGLHHNLTRLDITSANASQEGQWHHHHHAPQPVYYAQPPPQGPPHYPHHQHSMSMPEGPVTPKRNKRQGWYGGPLSGAQPSFVNQRPSPEDSGSSDGVPTPSTSQVAEYHPVIVNPAGAETFAPGPAMSEEQHKVYHAPAQEHKPGPVRTDSGFHQSHAPPPPPHTYALQAGHDPRFTASYPPHTQNNDMGRLEALVAVATSESRAEGRP